MLAPIADKYILTMFTEDLYEKANGTRQFIPMKRTGFSTLFINIVGGIANTVAIWYRTRKIENELHELSDHILSDIGVERWNIQQIAQVWAAAEVNPANDDHADGSYKAA